MNYTERAKQLGFSAAAVMDTKNLVFKPEYRVFCEENRCGNYDRNPACPPESGSVEEMKEKALSYNKTLVLQTTQSNDMDYKKAKLVHNRLTESLAEEMKKDGKSDLLIMTAGPYRHHSYVSILCGCSGNGRCSRDDLLGKKMEKFAIFRRFFFMIPESNIGQKEKT